MLTINFQKKLCVSSIFQVYQVFIRYIKYFSGISSIFQVCQVYWDTLPKHAQMHHHTLGKLINNLFRCNNISASQSVSQSVSQWVMFSDFWDNYRIYRACELVSAMNYKTFWADQHHGFEKCNLVMPVSPLAFFKSTRLLKLPPGHSFSHFGHWLHGPFTFWQGWPTQIWFSRK